MYKWECRGAGYTSRLDWHSTLSPLVVSWYYIIELFYLKFGEIGDQEHPTTFLYCST